jgi:hypothetical protein
MKRMISFLLGLGLGVSALAGRSLMAERALMDSARMVPPKMRMEWLYQHGEKPRIKEGGLRAEADSGLKLVGKWGRGPAAEVTGKDTLVVLTLGSEVALLNFSNPDSPVVLSEIQFPSLTAQSYLVDSLLYTSSNADLEVWNISDPDSPVQRGTLPAPVGDFWIRDTFLYHIRRDTFHVLSIANSANLHDLGSCVESGSVTTGSGNTVVVCQGGGLAFVDVSNPANPHQVGTYSCGHALSATARGNLVCASYEETADPYPVRFITLDISTPSSPRLLGKLNDLGGYDIFLDGPLAFVSGRDQSKEPFQIISIVDSAHPAFVDSCRTTQDANWGVWSSPSLNRAFVADGGDGLAVVDVSNLNDPVLDTFALVAATAEDVAVQGSYCYVADGLAGLRVLDISNPNVPHEVGSLDTSYMGSWSYSVAVQDSFAFFNLYHPWFRTADISDPTNPRLAGGCSYPPNEEPKAIVVRDTFAYAAMSYDFNVINVARPREPVVVGTCGLPYMTYDLGLQGTLAYVPNGISLQVVDVATPDSPHVIGSWNGIAFGLDVRDTILYVVGQQVLNTISVANPAALYLLDSLPLPFITFDVVVTDSVAYVGGYQKLQAVDVSDSRNLKLLGAAWIPPYAIHRLTYEQPHIYVACTDGGVSIIDTLQTGVSEGPSGLLKMEVQAVPTVTAGRVKLLSGNTGPWQGPVTVFDASGAKVSGAMTDRNGEVDFANAPSGVYLLRYGTEKGSGIVKVVKTTRR